ncbi:MAG: hypothetical protein ACI9KE_005759 [Polyangiales bacterium]|jgi:hypothetical protein
MPDISPNLVPKHKRSLDILTVPEPCEEPWNEMAPKGDGRRHCAMCIQDVFDLSTMTREAAEALLFESTGQVCVRFYRRGDGTVVTSDCTPVRHRALRRTASGALKMGTRVASACLAMLAALGVTRAAGVDVFAWVRSTDVGKELLFEDMEPMAGEPMMHIEIEDYEESIEEPAEEDIRENTEEGI